VGGLLVASLALLLLHRNHPYLASKYIWWPKWCASPDSIRSINSVGRTKRPKSALSHPPLLPTTYLAAPRHNGSAGVGQTPDVPGPVQVPDRAWITRHAPNPAPASLEIQPLSPRARPGTAIPPAPHAMPGSSSPLQGGPAGTGQPAIPDPLAQPSKAAGAGHMAGSLVGAGEHFRSAAASQQPGHHRPLSIRAPPNSIVLPAAAAPLLQALRPTAVRKTPQAGSVAPQASCRPSSQGQPSQHGTARTQAQACAGQQDEAPYSRAQQLALIENELKDIRQGFLSAAITSMQSRLGSTELYKTTTIKRPQEGSSTGSKPSDGSSSAGSPAEAALADHIPGLVLFDTLG
jgi:hypothetical protein